MDKQISNRIKQAMEEKGLTYRALENKTGISRSTLQRYIEKEDSKVSLDSIEKIARALHIEPLYLIGYDALSTIDMEKYDSRPVKKIELPLLNNIGERIKTLRKRSGMTQEELSDKLGFHTKSAISKIEKGHREPSIGTLILIADYFNVSVDFLLGRTVQKRKTTMTVGEIIKKYREENKISQRQFAVRCGISNGYISMLENGINPTTGEAPMPSLSALNNIARGMNTSLQNLLTLADGLNISISPANETGTRDCVLLSEEEKSVILAFRAQPEMRKAIFRILKIKHSEQI